MTSLLTETSPPAFNGYPKITPYRLAFIGTTGGLGIAKAILVSQGQTASSTTIEWITGVVVALCFQFLGACEYQRQRSVYIQWIFSYDCLNIPKSFIHIFRRAVGTASSESVIPHPSHNGANAASTPDLPAIVTAYRLLVSTSVCIVGLAKMLCAYLGFPTAMNTLDWIMAVPLTLGLYYLGTFEDRHPSRPRRLFDVDYSGIVKRALNKAIPLSVYLIGVTLCIFWIKYWSEILMLAWHAYRSTPTHNLSGSRGQKDISYLHTVKCVTVLLSAAMIQVGTTFSGALLWIVLRRLNTRRADPVWYRCFLFFLVSVYINCVLLFVYLLMLFRLPHMHGMALWIAEEFAEEPYLTRPVVGAIYLLMRFWSYLACVLLFIVPPKLVEFYNSHSFI